MYYPSLRESCLAVSNVHTERRSRMYTEKEDYIKKQHILEDQLVECITKFKVDLGYLSEQGHESIHHEMKKL